MQSTKTIIPSVQFVVEQLENRLQLSAAFAHADAQTRSFSALTNVTSDSTKTDTEMSLSVNPKNPLQLAGITDSFGAPDITLLRSSDGGLTWSKTVLNSLDGYTGAGRYDPVISFDDDGRLFVGYFLGTATTTRLIVARSYDGGANLTFFSAYSVNSVLAFDKEMLAVGKDHQGNAALYFAYTSPTPNAQRPTPNRALMEGQTCELREPNAVAPRSDFRSLFY